MHRRTLKVLALAAAMSAIVSLAACGGGAPAPAPRQAAKGPITIWYSNNEQEVAWGKAMVASWNAAHADQKVNGQEIPAGKTSEEVIGAAITAGTAPCLVFNTAPSAVGPVPAAGRPGQPGDVRRRRQPTSPTERRRWPTSTRPPTAASTSCPGSPTR